MNLIERDFSCSIFGGDGLFTVSTPISYEEGFKSLESARKYVDSYGRDDDRKNANQELECNGK